MTSNAHKPSGRATKRRWKTRKFAIGVLVFFLMGGILISCGGSSTPQYTAGQDLTLTGKMKIIDAEGFGFQFCWNHQGKNCHTRFQQVSKVEAQALLG
ncbi:MAG: hypothetical protein R6X05_08565 [Desulfobacterales bacterium]